LKKWCVCVCWWWWCKKKAPTRSYRSWPQSRTHIRHRSKARETCGSLLSCCSCSCPGDPGQHISRHKTFFKAKRQKGRHTHTHTHTLWYWLVMHVRTKGIFFLNNEKKNLSIASSSSSFYSFFVFCLFQITSFFLFFIFCRPHTHTHGILCPL
jgi:hypothetical protein